MSSVPKSPSIAKVNLELYDMEGRKVRTLLERSLGVGQHHLDFYPQHLAAGTYAYQLSTSNEMGVFRKSKILTILS